MPCGGEGQLECDSLCYIVDLLKNIMDFLLFCLAMPAAVIGFIAAGIMFLTAGGNEQQLEKGKSIFKNVD